jgi:hypothetical protein
MFSYNFRTAYNIFLLLPVPALVGDLQPQDTAKKAIANDPPPIVVKAAVTTSSQQTPINPVTR